MPKAKLKISTKTLGKLKLAAEFSDATLSDKVTKLGEDSIVTLSARSSATFFEVGRMIDKITDEQVQQAVEEVKAQKEAAKAAKK